MLMQMVVVRRGRGGLRRMKVRIGDGVGARQVRRGDDLVVEAAPKAESLQRVAVVAVRQGRAAQVDASCRA